MLEYDNEIDRNITYLKLVDGFGNTQFEWSKDGGEKTINTQHKEPQYSNVQILTDFCGKKKKEEGVNKDELLKFYNYYFGKISNFKNKFDADKLFNSWMARAAS